MRKVYCEELIERLANYVMNVSMYSLHEYTDHAEIRKEIKEIMEEFENDEPEKCAHCGKSLKGMTILDGLHYHPRGSYCSKECYDAGCKTKEES